MPRHPHIQTIQSLAQGVFDHLVRIRRDLHCHPELSGHETWTAHYLAHELEGLGLVIRTGVGGHGLWADLVSDRSQPTVALRVDIDALPIQEVNRVPYRSTIPRVMHACGHDAHSAIGIGVAAVLSQMRTSLPGNIRFIFQPEEEEITGAQRMIRAGVLIDPAPAAIFGLHVAPLPVGVIGWTPDLFLAGFEHYLVTLTDRDLTNIWPGHLDAVARRCCQVINHFNTWHLPTTWAEMGAFWKLMQLGPRQLKNFITYTASPNVEDLSAWEGQFGLGITAANPHLRLAAVGRVRAALNTICGATRTRYNIEPMGSMIDMRNDPQLVLSNLPMLTAAVGPDHLIHLRGAFPFNCEDFAYYTKRIPGAMYWLGAANPAEGKYAMLHTPDFDIDERCILTGTIAMATLLVNTLVQRTYHHPDH
jgi:metal-dependent amidase/aminoacylase/carboxypeptidase family protein